MRRVVAFQLSLFGEKPKAMGAWRPPFFTWSIFGVTVPLDDAELRQYALQHPIAASENGILHALETRRSGA